MAILKEIGKFLTFGGLGKKGYDAYKHSKEKKKRRLDREKAKVQEAQKLGLKLQQRQADVMKDIIKGKYGQETSLKQLRKDEERALRYSEDILAPQRERMLQEAQTGYERFTRPSLVGQFQQGPQGSTAGSSALNQALAASAADLSNQIGQQYNQMKYGLASDLLQRRELGRQQNLSSMLSVAGFPNQIAQGIAQTQVPKQPSLLGSFLPAAGAATAGYFSGGNPAAIQAGYGLGQNLQQQF